MDVPFAPGTLVLIRYGNGTQVARVSRILKGGYRIDRFRITQWVDRTESGVWVPSPTTQPFEKVIGPLPLSDKRRAVPGFNP
jgi:hypothetical protein